MRRHDGRMEGLEWEADRGVEQIPREPNWRQAEFSLLFGIRGGLFNHPDWRGLKSHHVG